MFMHKANLWWNLPDEISIHKANSGETYQIKCLYKKRICDETYQIKCLYIKWTYITLDNTPNKIFKNIFMSFGHYYKYFEKNPKIQL